MAWPGLPSTCTPALGKDVAPPLSADWQNMSTVATREPSRYGEPSQGPSQWRSYCCPGLYWIATSGSCPAVCRPYPLRWFDSLAQRAWTCATVLFSLCAAELRMACWLSLTLEVVCKLPSLAWVADARLGRAWSIIAKHSSVDTKSWTREMRAPGRAEWFQKRSSTQRDTGCRPSPATRTSSVCHSCRLWFTGIVTVFLSTLLHAASLAALFMFRVCWRRSRLRSAMDFTGSSRVSERQPTSAEHFPHARIAAPAATADAFRATSSRSQTSEEELMFVFVSWRLRSSRCRSMLASSPNFSMKDTVRLKRHASNGALSRTQSGS
mmetsp:Transcript_23614/g.69087  ORF Transcript_23614/g.69087 Transcript_23614/m.69087 type:complete len:323 (-) Transcript_23614:486-1454(-)